MNRVVELLNNKLAVAVVVAIVGYGLLRRTVLR